jgi:hypothetical protein
MNRFTLCLLACASFGYANTFYFATPINAVNPSDSQAVDVFASITTAANSISITITDREANPSAVSQLVSGFDFSLTSAGQVVSAQTPTASGQLIDGGGWSATPVLDFSDTINRWKFTTTGATNTAVALTALSGGTADLIIGNPGSGGSYTNANGSVNNCHACPLILHDATFTLAINGITTNTNVNTSSVQVLFGTATTGETVNMSQTTAPAPEPGSLALLFIGAGFIGLGMVGRVRSPANPKSGPAKAPKP